MPARNPFISFVIPVHNGATTIERCVLSITSQQFDEIEVIVVDDMSTDETAEIVEKLAQADNRIRLSRFEDNRTAHCARYDGAVQSRGKYVWFVDGDDEITPGSCKTVHDILSKRPVDILHFGTDLRNDGGLPKSRVDAMIRFVRPYNGRLSGRNVFEGCFVEGKYKFNIWNKVFDGDLCRMAFSKMTYKSMPKAQDEYEYYVLSYYARSYYGLPNSNLYVYHFGIGITGHNLLTIKQFSRYCSMSVAYAEMESFTSEVEADGTYEKTLENIKLQLFGDCLANWTNNVPTELKGAGFDLMVESWGDTLVIGELAKKNWYNQGACANYLLTSNRMKMKGRKVKTIATFYHTYKNGGVQRVITGLMRTWLSLGYRVILITDEPPTDDDYSMPPQIPRIVIPSSSEVTRDTYITRAETLKNVLKDNGVDVIVYHAWVSNILLWDILTCKLAGVSFISHCHNIFSMLARNSRAYFAALPNIYRLCDGVVTLSDVDKLYWSNFNSNTFEVFNPFSFDLDSVPRSSLDSKTVLWIGRMSDEKRPKDALKIMKIVLESVPDAKLIMVGGGNPKLMNELYSLLDELEIRDSVVMQGFMQDVLPIYKFASVLLCTSEYEGFLLTLAEAMSAGVPCVMYELPYLTLTRRNLGTIQVPQMNTKEAASEVVRMLTDTEYRKEMGRQALECITSYKDYDFEGTWQGIMQSMEVDREPICENDASKIMWDTLMTHYRTGALKNNTKVDELMKMVADGNDPVLSEKTVEQYENEIKAIKDSFTYRVGEMITYIPKYIRGDFKK